jgi:hypothetical protein
MIKKLVVEVWQEKQNSNRGKDSPYFHSLANAAKSLGLEFEARIIKRSSYTIQRQAASDELLLSHHTIGYAPQVFRLKMSYLKNYFYVDRTGFSGWSELAINPDLQALALQENTAIASHFVDDLRRQLIINNESKYDQPNQSLGNAIPKNCVFIALQKTTDISSELAYIKQYDLLDYLSQIASIFPNLQFVIKRHPKCKDKRIARKLANLSSNNVLVTQASLHDILPRCQLVITCNSGVGFESLIYHKPVVCVGKSDYELVCSTAKTMQQLSDYLVKFPSIDHSKIDSFLYFYLTKYCINIQLQPSVDEKIKTLISSGFSPLSHELTEFIEAERVRLNHSAKWGWRERNFLVKALSRISKKLKQLFYL